MLLQAAAGDTPYRDVYLRRARELVSEVLSETDYRDLAAGRTSVDQWLEKSKAAVQRQDWATVQALSQRAATMRRAIDANAGAMTVAESVYDAPVVVFDPYSRGLEVLARKDGDARTARAETLAALAAIERDDESLRALCAWRRDALDELVLPEPVVVEGSGSAKQAGVTVEQQALAAAQRGDAETLARLAEQMLHARPPEASKTGDAKSVGTPAASLVVPPELAVPLPDAAVEAARRLGLESVTTRPAVPGMASAIREFLERYAAGASPAMHEMARDGIERLGASVAEEVERLGLPGLTREHAETLAENLSLFALHLYVNSAGVRYVPPPASEECVLVEAHGEGDESVSPLLAELGLAARRGLSRDEIERALLLHGQRVLSSIGLDPLTFRLVCIPPDLFMRLGAGKGWGKRREWVHLDGYQVLRGGRRRALVGGNSEFGGLADLCSISPADARGNVLLRLAVVRRARLAVRLG